jgi:branched-chain amino acid transport system substrate-binding protein
VLDDGEVDGLDAANSFSLAAQGAGLRVLGVESFDPTAQDYRSLATAVAQTGADCVLFSALTENHAVALTTQVAAAMPKAKLFGTAPLGEPSYTSPDDGGLPPDVASRVTLTVPVLEHSSYPPAGRAFFAAYERRYGSAEPYAIYGYEAMSLMLNAISRATDHGRKAARRSKVVQALFQTRERRSVLGTYGIDRDGDTTLRRYGVYRIVDGGLVFAGALPG